MYFLLVKNARRLYLVFAFFLSPVFFAELFVKDSYFDALTLVTWSYAFIGVILFIVMDPWSKLEKIIKKVVHKLYDDKTYYFRPDIEIWGKFKNRYLGFDHDTRTILLVDVMLDTRKVVRPENLRHFLW
ncbi:hypothetical protein [Zooshikella ganghwensis]|uniref:Uncharacterized protein n=1 Tax=Zooshikella ganghwensis TaxID=202772 RepID=A0A4V1IMY8_9GAMM|nr:hypothetical protein [Zooshikella ganghwensis]RDH41881.1 hypothetical protein B9G39_26035 [Zooshikella ganghwensis]